MAEHQHAEQHHTHHEPAVRHVIAVMRARLHEPLTLADLAAEAYLSRFHFGRVFSQVTGSAPGEFLGALRLDAARALLLTTSLSVTDVCYEVGYASLGSFTTRFTSHVGLTPSALRHLATAFEPALVRELVRGLPRVRPPAGATLSGVLAGSPRPGSTICAGLFARGIPSGLPVACTQVDTPGPFQIHGVPDGVYYLRAAALPPSGDPLLYLAPGLDLRHLLVATHSAPIQVVDGATADSPVLTLRPPSAIDPPLVASLPLLLARWCAPEQVTEQERSC
jgi:AraC family transcriptional regulator